MRCKWCNLNNPLYVKYHDEEWGKLCTEDNYLFEMLVLESFQAGLSWECVLNKREAFRLAFDGFDYRLIALYDEVKVETLFHNQNLIRNLKKIKATINNAKVFQKIVNEWGSFYHYLTNFTKGLVYYELNLTKSTLSTLISKDLYNKGMRFVGPTIIYAYLQAIGVINSHGEECFLYPGSKK